MSGIKNGLFITFEGPDGSGKSTHIKLLYDLIVSRGYPCICTREPGGTKVGEKLRDILKDTTLNGLLSIRTEVLLLQAARAQHVHETIKPALEEGMVVLCDRYADSSTVYQGVAHEIGKDVIGNLNEFATSGLEPDLTILLDISPDQGLGRADNRENGKAKDRWEELGIDFHEKVRKAFLDLAEENSERYRIVPAGGTIEEVHQGVVEFVDMELPLVEA